MDESCSACSSYTHLIICYISANPPAFTLNDYFFIKKDSYSTIFYVTDSDTTHHNTDYTTDNSSLYKNMSRIIPDNTYNQN